MPLAQSTPSNVATEIPTSSRTTDNPSSGNLDMGQVPYETYRYFGVNPGTVDKGDLKQIKDVYDWANKDSAHMGESMHKLRQLENKLGQPPIGETRYSKMWNWVRVSKMVSTLEQDREAQIKKVTQARETEIKRVRAEKEKQIAELESRRKSEETAIRKARQKELNQFKRLRQAYE
jgi:hypothetical protein